ncbi:MAG: Helix-turn-helix domain protein [Bryobacterales bacterium]|jgi:DNA-binding transcriptional ArsR family regulator|nr:Helix-turn-helix domain protein [Bryobacterales bacterium]
MGIENAMRALASEKRLLILQWLKTPVELFPPQVSGDLRKDGVCGLSIAQKLKVSQPTASQHLKILTQAGLIEGTRIKQWTFYKRDEQAIKALKKDLVKNL